MEICLVRIDDRLVHGQVVTIWTKLVSPERIVVVCKEAYNDKIRRVLVGQAAPPDVKVNLVDVEKAIRVFHNPKYAKTKVFLLFANPTEVLEMVQAGIPIQEVNVGGITYTADRTQITKAISVTKEDVHAFRELSRLGVKLDCRFTASDSPIDFEARLDDKFGKEN
ncbi:PTS system mannose/fructose/N-acetylgalactosamine-transporter subunit IIB [Listeria booriae]|uniref:PTS transporter subunit IIB n=1 Tax=Listeria booriae TaxID=1552123 RepID=A0A7X0YMX0_9LIST|nr:mannose/fructose/sorbose PTS transporter subunit IIB [Listeria booriae]MBC1778058.1 PTS transporter subunit IIB [Listeria booriae]MBC1795421.1 PTS transporter subunit IIB [Listeria booriae]MBC1799058.1 PTS transporter subunit IIB [Listeria booriae]MBC1802201.1 PTS transporter subunit IIB [Listeria booriae]MBC1887043.1 PTS transporter subunit IIB [Listeria booriae]